MPTKPRPRRRYKRGSAMPTTPAPPFPGAGSVPLRYSPQHAPFDEFAAWAGRSFPRARLERMDALHPVMVLVREQLNLTGVGAGTGPGLTAEQVALMHPDALEAVAAWSGCFAFARPDGGRLLRESDAQDVRLFAVG